MTWSQDVFTVLQTEAIGTIATVPDGGLVELLNLCEASDDTTVVTLSTEEEGMGLLLGLHLGGARGALFMQSSGTGNCINALSLPAITRTPCLMLVTMRGQEGEMNPWQVPMGQGVVPAFEAMGVTCLWARAADDIGPRFLQASDLAFGRGERVAVLIDQSVIGTKEFAK